MFYLFFHYLNLEKCSFGWHDTTLNAPNICLSHISIKRCTHTHAHICCSRDQTSPSFRMNRRSHVHTCNKLWWVWWFEWITSILEAPHIAHRTPKQEIYSVGQVAFAFLRYTHLRCQYAYFLSIFFSKFIAWSSMVFGRALMSLCLGSQHGLACIKSRCKNHKIHSHQIHM